MLGYPSNILQYILGYPSIYWNYTSKRKLGRFPHSPQAPLWITFLPFTLLWSKITIFIIEISLKLHLHKNTGWNNYNSHKFGLKSQKFNFLTFLGAQKSSHTKTFKYISRAQFSSKLWVWMKIHFHQKWKNDSF